MTREEAIDILMSANVWNDEERTAWEVLIPELAESEDERILRVISEAVITFFSDYANDFEDEDRDAALAWLEKQKGQKPAEWSDTNELVFQDICKHLKEEGFGGWVVLLEALKNGEFNQSKLEWSEEDEKNCNRIIRFLEPHKTFFPTKETKEEMQNWLNNRLKSLRPSWKPSEEQQSGSSALKAEGTEMPVRIRPLEQTPSRSGSKSF